MIVPGCGWIPDIIEIVGGSEPTAGSPDWPPCVARDGYRPYHRDNYTVGAMGLCVGCLEQPADLLAILSAVCADRLPA